MKKNICNNYIFNFAILSIILLIILPTKSQINSFVYEETQTGNLNPPIIYDIQTYNDNKIIVRIVRENSSASVEHNNTCFDNYLSLRTIYPDGMVVAIDISLDIPDI